MVPTGAPASASTKPSPPSVSTASSTSCEAAGVDLLGDIVQLGAGIAIPHSFAEFATIKGFGRFVSAHPLFDIADDLLDQILDGDQSPVGAGKLRQPTMARCTRRETHIDQHVQGPARLRHKNIAAAQQRGPVGRRRGAIARNGKTSLIWIIPITSSSVSR